MVFREGGKFHRVAVKETQAMRLKIRDSHLTCKVVNKCLNVLERIKIVSFFPLQSYESSMSAKENSDSKKFRIETKAPKLGPLAGFGKILLSVSYDQHFFQRIFS